MKNNVKKFSLIFGLVVCVAAVMLGIFLLNSNKNIPLSVSVFYSETGEYCPGFNGGEIAIFNGSEQINTITQNNKLTLPEPLQNPENLTIQASPKTGFGFAGFYSSSSFSADSLLSNNPNFAPPKNTKVFAKFGSLVDVTFNVTTENPDLSEQITTQQPLTKHMQNSDFLQVVNQNCTPEITAYYSGKTAELTQNSGTGSNTFQITTTAQTLTLQPAEIDEVGHVVPNCEIEYWDDYYLDGGNHIVTVYSDSSANHTVLDCTVTKTGYTFAGWKWSMSNEIYQPGENFVTSEFGVRLYAVWQANTYTIVYHANGGHGTTASSTHTYDTAQALTANGFSKSGYKFVGWSTSTTQNKVTYYNQQSVLNLTSTNGATINLYAVWGHDGEVRNSFGQVDSVNLVYTPTYPWTVNTSGNETVYKSYLKNNITSIMTITFTVPDYDPYFYYKLPNHYKGYVGLDSETNYIVNTSYAAKTLYTITGLQKGSQHTIYCKYYSTREPGPYVEDGSGYYFEIIIVDDSFLLYNLNGGSGTFADQIVSFNTTTTLYSITPTREGYKFLGWAHTPEETTGVYQPGETVNLHEAVTLYAIWKPDVKYTIAYNANGGTGTTASSDHTYDEPKALTANGFTREGYNFLGWNTNQNATTPTYTNGQSVQNLTTTNGAIVTLYAVWECVSFFIQYNANGGSGTMPNSVHPVANPGNISTCTYTRTGYIFQGWSTNQNAILGGYGNNIQIPKLAEIGETVVMYAIWLRNYITITINPNGGLYNGTENATAVNCTLQEDVTLDQPTRHGYAFVEFNTSGDGTGTSFDPAMHYTSDITFYAIWEPLNYYINYYDGDLYLGQTVAWYNETLSLTAWSTLLSNNSLSGGKFTQYGWNFAGWTADTNGTTVQHNNGAPVLNLTEAGTTINLYAMHTQTLSLTYNGNGSTSGGVAPQNCDLMLNSKNEKINDFVITLANNSFAKTNYSFKNWAIGSTSGTQKSAGVNITNADLKLTYLSTFNITIYAIWQGNAYTINYYNGTSKISTGNYVYGTNATLKTFSTIGTVNNLAYGWEFYGWATANNTFTRVFEDAANITNISVDDGSEITQNMVINLYSIYVRTITFVSGLHTNTTTTTAEQYWNSYSTAVANYSAVLAPPPQAILSNGWIALGYRSDIKATTASYVAVSEIEIKPAVNAFNTLYAVYSRTITIADLNGNTTATQHYNSAGTVSTVGQ